VTRDSLLVLELYHLFCNIVGGVASPLLANIYLDQLDQYVEQVLIPAYTHGEKRAANPAYKRLADQVAYRKRTGQKKEYKDLQAVTTTFLLRPG